MPQHNARFALPAEVEGSAFVSFAGALDDILCIQEERTVSNDNTVRYKRRVLQLPADRHRRHYVKDEYPDGTLAVFHGPRCLARYQTDGEPIDTPPGRPRDPLRRDRPAPVDKWTAAQRLTTSPQAQQHQQKRSTHLVHKPVNSECSRHFRVRRRVTPSGRIILVH